MSIELHLTHSSATNAPTSEYFSRYMSSLSEREQLEFCEIIFRDYSHVKERWYQVVFQAWTWIEHHKLYKHAEKGQAEYWKDIDGQYSITPIITEIQNNLRLQQQIQARWNISIEECLGSLCPPVLGRTFLEELNRLARCCPDVVTAQRLLKSSPRDRPPRSRRNDCIITSDVKRATENYKAEEARCKSTHRHQNHSQPNPGVPAPKRRKCQAKSRLTRRKRQKRQRRSPPGSPASLSSASSRDESSIDATPDPSSPDSATCGRTPDGVEDQKFAQILRQYTPFQIPGMMTKLQEELDRLDEELEVRRKQRDWCETWGEYYIRRIRKVLKVAKPARLFVQGVPPGIQFGIYRTASREDADVLCLIPEEAADVLSLGPSDGKAVFIRHGGERWRISADELLSHIERYRVADVQVQDPSISTDVNFLQHRSPTDIAEKLRCLLEDKMTVGYDEHQIPPMNLLSMPKMWPGELHCLSKTESTQIYDRLRCMNHVPGLPASESALGTILSAHLAASLVHVDGNGHGTAGKNMFGYKMWISWPGLVGEGRAEFHRKGNEFHGQGSRYILIAPEDEYIQTPCVSQDIHSVVTLGYCGVVRCVDDCVSIDQPRCCGFAAMGYKMYWNERYMADSLQSIIDALDWKKISSEESLPDLENLLHDLTILMQRDKTFLGSSDARQRFEEKKEVALTHGCCFRMR